ncbi:MAG TPA: VWA domain-containing protein [Steroidobacteraceae bacterium]|nr:VWA domain-containing protein [Steroidobacteraceae bacterium]
MLVRFFTDLRAGGVPATLPEFLVLLEGLDARLAALSPEDFYYLARTALVKDERHFDRFDRVFARHFAGAEDFFQKLMSELPEDWLRQIGERLFSAEEKARVEGLGGWQKLIETLKQRLREQQERHEGGSKWIGTGGTSPFGHGGFNPEGVRIGSQSGRHGRAAKIWEAREYRNLDGESGLGTRNIKMALRRLRRFAREGAPEELDLDGTIQSTARNAGILDLRMQAERRNAVKLLLLLDVGGSMDPHVRQCEELFSAARAEFKHLEYFYFHNFLYERLWKDNRRRFDAITDTRALFRTFHHDYHVVFVGDATMSPYEIEQPGGSVEHWNEESGRTWMLRFASHFPRLVWLNPEPEDRWKWTASIGITRELIGGRMFALTIDGIDGAMYELRRRSPYTAPHVS